MGFGVGWNGRCVTCSVLGLSIPCADEESRLKAVIEIEAKQDRFIAAAERRLGRKLSTKELLRGAVDRKEIDSLTERRLKAKWQSTLNPLKDEGNPYTAQIQAHLDEIEESKDRKLFQLKMLQRDWDAKRAAAQTAAELAESRANNAEYQSCVRQAKNTILALKFDERASAADVFEAEARLQLAQNGRLDEYKTHAAEFSKTFRLKCEELAKPAREQAERLVSNLSLDVNDFSEV